MFGKFWIGMEKRVIDYTIQCFNLFYIENNKGEIEDR